MDGETRYKRSSLRRYKGEKRTSSISIIAYCYFPQYATNFKRGNDSIAQKANYTGTNAKSLHVSVEASLKKLRTSYIDLLYVHWWDYETSIKEVMDSLHTLVMQGKVLYLVSLAHNYLHIFMLLMIIYRGFLTLLHG